MITPSQFVQTRTEQGMQTVEAVRDLARVLCTTERQAWNLHTGKSPARQAHMLLLTLYEQHPELRPLWPTPPQN